MNETKIEEFKVYLSEQNSATYFMLDKFNIFGSLYASNKQKGYKLYKVKVMEEIFSENDPNFFCRIYPNIGDFGKVVSFNKGQ